MVDIGLRSGKVVAGLYRCGRWRIEKIGAHWHAMTGNPWATRAEFKTMTEAYLWCRRQPEQ